MGGLKTKLHELSENVNYCRIYDAIILVESWLSEDISDAELNFKAFNIFRLDRNFSTSEKSRGGGIIIAVNKRYNAHTILCKVDNVEHLFVSVSTSFGKFVLGGVYIPPNSPLEVYQAHCDALDDLNLDYKDSDIIIAGDYNLPGIKWSKDGLNSEAFCSKRIYDSAFLLAESCAFLNCTQINSIPNSRNIFLDLVFSNTPNLNCILANDILLNNSMHHNAYCLNYKCKIEDGNLNFNEYSFDWFKADYANINCFLNNINWENLFSNCNIDEAANQFYVSLYEAIRLFVPKKQIKTSNFPCWFSNELISLTIQKKRIA